MSRRTTHGRCGHLKTGTKLQKVWRSDGSVKIYDVAYCKICANARTIRDNQGYVNVRVSRLQHKDLTARAREKGVPIHAELRRLLSVAMSRRL